MSFRPTQARFSTLRGLQLRDGSGPWFQEETKTVVLDAGFVMLTPLDGDEVVYPVEIPTGVLGNGTVVCNGTTDPLAMTIARRRSRQEIPSAPNDEWGDIALSED